MVDTEGGDDRSTVAQRQKTAPAERVGLAEVDPGTFWQGITDQLTADHRVGRGQSSRDLRFTVWESSPRYARYKHRYAEYHRCKKNVENKI